MRHFAQNLLWLAVALLGAGTAQAAQISSFKTGEGTVVILVTGEIVDGDAKKFKNEAEKYDSAVVALESRGGKTLEAIDIGEALRLKGFSTVVLNGSECTSSCGLIWLAGAPRALSRSARVGFHAAYTESRAGASESGVGNAIVGRYLTLLNLPVGAIVFATTASPDTVNWLTTSNYQRYGIDLKVIDDLETDSAPTTPPGIQATSRSSARDDAPTPAWYYASYSDGTTYYVRGKDVQSSRSDSRDASMWLRGEPGKGSNDKSSRALMAVDCVNETYRIETLVLYDAKGNARTVPIDGKLEHVVPGSALAGAVDLICSDQVRYPDKRDLYEQGN